MDKPVSTPIVYAFEHFRLDKQARQLLRLDANAEAVPVLLGARALDILLVLVERSGEVVSKAQLMDAVWPGLAVEESNLTVQIAALRRALDNGRHGPSLIQTVHARGYLLTAVATPAIAPLRREPPHDSAFKAEFPAAAPLPSGPSVGQRKLPRLSVAMAVLRNFGVAEEHERLAEGIIEDVSDELSQQGISVVGSADAPLPAADAPKTRSIAHELGVSYVIQGSIRGAADRTVVNLQLINVETGVHVSAEQFAVHLGGTMDARNEINHRVAWTLFTKLTEDVDRRLESIPRVDWTPHDLIDRGRAMLFRPTTVANRLDAIKNFEQALAADPASVGARIGIASALVMNIADWWGASVEQDERRAEQILLDILGANAKVWVGHLLMGVLRRFQGQMNESRIELEIAIELAPTSSNAVAQLGITLICLAEPDAAIPLLEKSLRLSPHDFTTPIYHACLGLCHLLLGDTDDAITSLKTARALNPSMHYTHWWLAAALGLKGELEEASAALSKAIEIRPEVVSPSGSIILTRRASPRFAALLQRTVFPGLRRAGLPEP